MLLTLLMMEKSSYISVYNWTYCLSFFGESTCSGKPSEKSYDHVVTVMKTLYSPRPLVIIQCYRTYSGFHINIECVSMFCCESHNSSNEAVYYYFGKRWHGKYVCLSLKKIQTGWSGHQSSCFHYFSGNLQTIFSIICLIEKWYLF